MPKKTNDLIALGNTLMDFLVEVEDSQLSELNLKKGEFHLVEEAEAKAFLKKISQTNLAIETVPGGSAANTLKGFALLGGKAILYGKVGNDLYGQQYVQEMSRHQVISRINLHPSITGHALTFITPDAERTFSVCLGAALTLAKEDILEEDIQKSKILHLESYQFEGPTKEAVLHALALAKKHHTLISLDLADPGVVRRNKAFIKKTISNYADIVFANQAEAKELTGLEPEEALNEISKSTKTAIIKLGEKGSLISSEGIITFINPFPARAVDTTGAGDTFAAGFLYGCCRNWDIEKCGKLGSLMAAKIVEQKGVKIHLLNLKEIKKEIESNHSASFPNHIKFY